MNVESGMQIRTGAQAEPCRARAAGAEPWSTGGVAFAYRNLEGTNFS